MLCNRYSAELVGGSQVVYTALPHAPDTLLDAARAVLVAQSRAACGSARSSAVVRGGVLDVAIPGLVRVKPSAACVHERDTGHSVHPRSDTRIGGRYLLDYPLPRELDLRSWRCSTCKAQRRSSGFPVLASDVLGMFDDALSYRSAKHGTVFMTRAFLLHLLSLFYETFNSRDVRRRLADVYAANALGLCKRHEQQGFSPYSLAWQLQAIPDSQLLRRVVMDGLRHFVAGRVEVMRRRQFVYNAQGLRADGHYKLASRVAVYVGNEVVRGRSLRK